MFFALSFALMALAEGSLFSSQCLHAYGQLKCPMHAHRAQYVHLELKDIDDGPSGDDIMDTGFSTTSGFYHLRGCATDPVGDIDPVIVIHHNCTGTPKQLTITIPQSFIGKNWNATVTDLSNPPLNEHHKIEAFKGKLQKMCDEQHQHVHSTDRKRRSPDRQRRTLRPVQCLRAVGQLKCQGHDNLARQVWLQLLDDDSTEFRVGDEVMDTGYTSANGHFNLFGCASDPVGDIDPILVIKHKCGGTNQQVKITIPYATTVGHLYNATLDLQHPNAQYHIENYSGRMPDMCDDLHSYARPGSRGHHAGFV